MSDQVPTQEEVTRFAIRAHRGVELGLGQADPNVAIAEKLAGQYPAHLVLIQAGTFLHGFDRTAYALHVLKKYQMKLIDSTDDPHLRVGFPVANFKRRLWALVDELGLPYVVALGAVGKPRTIYTSTQPTSKTSVLASVSDRIVQEVIDDLRQHKELNKAAAKELLTNPQHADFHFKTQTLALDALLLHDIVKMPRDLRATYGENVRGCMARIVRSTMAYGMERNKGELLLGLSADIDVLKHYLEQAPGLSQLKFDFDHRAGLAVELGRLVGGLIKSPREARS